MNDIADSLIERVTAWIADPAAALQGWALRETLKRRGDADLPIAAVLESKLGPMRSDLIPAEIESATRSFDNLLADLDRDEGNLEHVRRESRDVFFLVLEALILVEESSGADGAADRAALAAALFNRVIRDAYAFEPAADLAADLERWGHGHAELSDLFCTAVSRLYDGQPRHRRIIHRPVEAVEVEAFLPVADFLLQSGPALTLTPATFADRLAKNPTWYAKWTPQRLRLTVTPKTRELRVAVLEFDPAGKEIASRALDGYEFRLGHAPADLRATSIQSGLAAMKLPDRIDPARFVLQLKAKSTPDWTDLFTRIAEVPIDRPPA